MSKPKQEHALLPVLTRVARGLELSNRVAAVAGNVEDPDLMNEVMNAFEAGLTDSQFDRGEGKTAESNESASESSKDKSPKLKIQNMDTAETLTFTKDFIAELEVEDGDEGGPIAQNFIDKVVAAQTAIGTASISSMTAEQNKLMSPALQTDVFNYRNNKDDSYAEIVVLANKKPAKAKIE